jgi:transcriptional regulator with XRE-family HTH domain
MLTSVSPTLCRAMAVSTDKTYYRELGRRIAERRKLREITQVELAKALGIAQQTMAHYEGGTLRVAVALLPTLARMLDLTLEELVGYDDPSAKARNKRGPAPKIQQQLERVSALPKARQRIIAEVLDSMLAQSSR